jgi:hypothetical protein
MRAVCAGADEAGMDLTQTLTSPATASGSSIPGTFFNFFKFLIIYIHLLLFKFYSLVN